MNKTFKDPNLKYSDQLTPLAQMDGFEGGGSSDIPTPTVADAGKVLTVSETGDWELGEGSGGGGVTLYGPYSAYNSTPVTTTGGSLCTIFLDEIYDAESNVVTFPQSEQLDGNFLLQQFSISIPPNTTEFPADDYKLNMVRPTAISIMPGRDANEITIQAYGAYTVFYSLVPPNANANSEEESTGDGGR